MVGKFVKTPRDLNRLHEATKFIWPHVPKGSDFFDFVWLQLIKLKVPKLYQWTRDYVQNVGAYRDGGRAGDREPSEQAEILRKIMKELNWAERGHYSGLGAILPGVGSFVLEGSNRKVFDFQRDELAKFERAKRLGSPSHWRQYFALDMPSYAIKDEEVSAFRRASKDDSVEAASFLMKLVERPHERPGHFVDLLLDRLSDAPRDSFSSEEISGIISVFAYTMDEIAEKSNEFTYSGRSEIWQKSTYLLHLDDPSHFNRVVASGNSINWLSYVVRDQGFAHGLPAGNREYPEHQWLARAQLDEAVHIIMARFQR
jgi:hypothetical protein